jgi:hypothetical protein
MKKTNAKEVKKEEKKEVKAMTTKQVLTLAMRQLRKSLNTCLKNGLGNEAVEIVFNANESASKAYRDKVMAARFANLTQEEIDYLQTIIKTDKPEEAAQEEVEA